MQTALVISFWMLAIFFLMAIASKMAKLSVFNHISRTTPAMKFADTKQLVPGTWAPEYILLFLTFPAGIFFAIAIVGTINLAGGLS